MLYPASECAIAGRELIYEPQCPSIELSRMWGEKIIPKHIRVEYTFKATAQNQESEKIPYFWQR